MASIKNKSLKLLVDMKSKKVLFAEAGKDFVDFLFSILELPLGSIMGFLVEKGMAGSGSVGRVYESVQDLDPSYLQPNQDKDSLFMPKKASSSTGEVGYVKGVVTYLVTDDLMVKPMSTTSSVTLLNNFNVKDVGNLQEKTVEVDKEKALELVKASFKSNTVLTDVFLWKKVPDW